MVYFYVGDAVRKYDRPIILNSTIAWLKKNILQFSSLITFFTTFTDDNQNLVLHIADTGVYNLMGMEGGELACTVRPKKKESRFIIIIPQSENII